MSEINNNTENMSMWSSENIHVREVLLEILKIRNE